MKNDRSIWFTSLAIKAALVLCVISLFVMPYAARIYRDLSIQDGDVTVPLLITFYSCAAVGIYILITLDRLVYNIKKGEVFIEGNVKLLRGLSYSCFIIAFITLIFAHFRFLSFIVTFSACFFGLILRVIKNCFTEAVALREENDQTI
ncbi:MAG: DUF2975 domain-containing protein [Oscillospiraceae bacterium]|nr:DUF2975 domain-containing protein [Oscillospiraceae bacterium]